MLRERGQSRPLIGRGHRPARRFPLHPIPTHPHTHTHPRCPRQYTGNEGRYWICSRCGAGYMVPIARLISHPPIPYVSFPPRQTQQKNNNTTQARTFAFPTFPSAAFPSERRPALALVMLRCGRWRCHLTSRHHLFSTHPSSSPTIPVRRPHLYFSSSIPAPPESL